MQAYIQYINKNGTIKAVEVERQEVGQKVHYVLPTIQEQFFILTVFDNNKRVLGLGFVDVENLDMLAFLNSDFQSVDALPEIAFFNAYQEIILETDLVFQNQNVSSFANRDDAYLYFENLLKDWPDMYRIESRHNLVNGVGTFPQGAIALLKHSNSKSDVFFRDPSSLSLFQVVSGTYFITDRVQTIENTAINGYVAFNIGPKSSSEGAP